MNANLADAHLELEKVYYHIGLTDKVIAAGEQVQRLDPSQALSSNRTFRALIDAGRLEQVRLDVDRNGNLGPYARGDALVALGRLQDALQFLSGSKATLPGDAEYDIGALALLGVVYARLEQPRRRNGSSPWLSRQLKIQLRSPTCIMRSFTSAPLSDCSAGRPKRCAGSRRQLTRAIHRILGSQRTRASRL